MVEQDATPSLETQAIVAVRQLIDSTKQKLQRTQTKLGSPQPEILPEIFTTPGAITANLSYISYQVATGQAQGIIDTCTTCSGYFPGQMGQKLEEMATLHDRIQEVATVGTDSQRDSFEKILETIGDNGLDILYSLISDNSDDYQRLFSQLGLDEDLISLVYEIGTNYYHQNYLEGVKAALIFVIALKEELDQNKNIGRWQRLVDRFQFS